MRNNDTSEGAVRLGAYKYRIEFTSAGLDETALRDELERRYGVGSLTISREGAALAPARNPRGVATVILELFADGRPHRTDEIFGSLPGVAKGTVNAALVRLVSKGLLVRLEHGVYLEAGRPPPAADEIPVPTHGGAKQARERILALLEEPRTAPELREQLGVSRQAVEQQLSKMVTRGLVVRLPVIGERAHHLYARKGAPIRAAVAARQPRLSSGSARALSALPPHGLSRSTDLAHAARLAVTRIGPVIEDLCAGGLALSFRLGVHRYVGLTPRGREHPERFPAAVLTAPVADLASDFGVARSLTLQVIGSLGEARTLDVTYALPSGIFDGVGHSTGQIVQGLERAGLVEPVEPDGKKHAAYRLTEAGREATAYLERNIPALDPSDLRTKIADRLEERSRRLAASSRGAARYGSPAMDAIVGVLRDHGPLETGQIPALMSVKFKNDKSIHLALRALRDRGVVVGERTGKGVRLIWRLA